MAKVTFYPINNADSTLMELADGRLLLKDYANYPPDDAGRTVRLDHELRAVLAGRHRDSFDVVAFSHADDDHTHGAEDFFWLDHVDHCQGEGRIKIGELWIPACFLLEANLTGSARYVRQEARHRFRVGQGIRVFGNPGPLESWLRNEGIPPASRSHLITTAGECVPKFNQAAGQVEIFSHSPFSYRMEGEEVDRNANSLVWHVTFFEGDRRLRLMLGADIDHRAWADLILKTESKAENRIRLGWDVFKVSHHCSYKALAEDKGRGETVPRAEVKSLFDRGTPGAILVASSKVIPAEDTVQPPHREAAAYYRRIARERGNSANFVVTMEWPTKDRPRPYVLETTAHGFRPAAGLGALGGPAAVMSRPSPRFGDHHG